MKPRHVYRPPRRNRFLSTAIIFGGGALLTFVVFNFIPLMQRLEQGLAPPEEDLVAPMQVEQREEYVEPPKDEVDKPIEDPEPVMADEIAPDIGDLPPITAGMAGRILPGVRPSVRTGGGSGPDNQGIDSDPAIARTARPNLSNSAKRKLSRSGAARIILSGFVDENGTLSKASVSQSCGIPEVDQAALKAFQRFKFKPAIRNGRKAKARIKYPMKIAIGG